MKLIISRFSWQPKSPGGAEMSAEQHAIYLEKLGHEVLFLTNYDLGRFRTPKRLAIPGNHHLQLIIGFLRLPLYTIFHKPDVYNPHSKVDQIVFSMLKPLHGKPVVWKDAGDLVHQISNKNQNIFGRIVKSLYAKSTTKADHIYTLNSDERNSIIKTVLELTKLDISNKISVIPSDIDFDDYNLMAPKSVNKDAFMVGYVGRIDKTKGIYELLDAMEILKHEKINLLAVGAGRDFDNARKIAQDKKLQVQFVGHQEISGYMRSFDLLVVPSHFEGWGRTVKEAMYFGLPVIATKVGGIKDQIDDTKTGLFTTGEPQDIARKILYLRQHPEISQRIGMLAKNRVKKAGDIKSLIKDRVEPLLISFYNKTV